MSFRRPFRCSFALLLVVSLLTGRLGSVSHTAFVEPIQNFISKKAQFVEDNTPRKSIFFKTKRSLSDVASTAEISLLEAYRPAFSKLIPCSPFAAIPEVFLDIFIPPDPPSFS